MEAHRDLCPCYDRCNLLVVFGSVMITFYRARVFATSAFVFFLRSSFRFSRFSIVQITPRSYVSLHFCSSLFFQVECFPATGSSFPHSYDRILLLTHLIVHCCERFIYTEDRRPLNNSFFYISMTRGHCWILNRLGLVCQVCQPTILAECWR